jgi:ADP-heptose:LPS heptosyltransferase
MTLPALAELRRLAPEADIELAVGSWNEELARGLPFVDRFRIVSVPWAAWGERASWRSALSAIRESPRPDLVIDFQGDVRVILLMATTGASLRAGYSDTGGGNLLTHRGEWDENKSWYRQNVGLLGTIFPEAAFSEKIQPVNFLLAEDRRRGQELLEALGLAEGRRPLIGIHPSAGRGIKQWEEPKFANLVDRLAEATSGTIILTGGPGDRDLVDRVAAMSATTPYRLAGEAGPGAKIGKLGPRGFSAVVERLDLFITGDTGPMHLADAVGTPGVAIFGPSDPRRYRPEDGSRYRSVVRESLYCSPCNMIRKPPRECARAEAPECLQRITVERVVSEALGRLDQARARSMP